ncbi:MAG: disulfide bond formation protein B [Proteobacteria bacterium]|nr:disulfide bond formation protein B [Pseudomonadota bacterium]
MARRSPAAGRLLVGLALAALGAVGIALASQYGFGMEPCPWCVLQRAIFVSVAIACLIAAALRGLGRRVFSGLGLLLALCGIAAALWQHFQAAASASCSLTLADRIMSRTLHLDALLPSVFEARASCADAAVSLLGVPYDFWSAAMFVLLAIGAWRAAARS